ncbi:hypothetical protein M5X17_31350 [Paenibacillus alvei]|uniref:hypothetical protein n=1 Tax=Paenibacillus alvei TaxID=44250 RepID=UPI00227F8274|nr:hypothetical protein [Paenibacillus alvei]MCY9738191.1 hypothetical protein [Paenibacillus alvei]
MTTQRINDDTWEVSNGDRKMIIRRLAAWNGEPHQYSVLDTEYPPRTTFQAAKSLASTLLKQPNI